jgi:hypothetical protein
MRSNIIRAGFGALLLSFAFVASAQDAATPATDPPAPAAAPTAATQAPASDAATPAPSPADAPVAANGTGTLLVDVLPFSSEVELKKKVRSQLEGGGVDWGLDGQRLVFTQVNKQFVNFNMGYYTRFGKQQSVTLPAGEYRLTGIGLNMGFGFDVQKLLAKGAYVNEDVIRFVVEPGKTTKLTVNPVVRADNAGIVKFFVPQLLISVSTDASATAPLSVTGRMPTSINWGEYQGDLKFKTP